ncbi:MAG: hypothetical protein JO032_13805 [Alphaproteobacteria bacterium]|nr:hypothetical protein [Alphaproteobacteria bacterium]
MRSSTTLALFAGTLAFISAGPLQPARADNLNSVVRSLNAVLNPDDARRLEDEARRNNRLEEERYWHNYGAGLDEERRDRPHYGAAGVSPDEARRLEEQAHRSGRWEEERYWHNYLAGLEGPRGDYRAEGRPRDNWIGPEEAARREAQARAAGRWDEARYWASYRSGLGERR